MINELQFLRQLEQDMQILFRNAEEAQKAYGGHAVTVHNLANGLRIDINQRIMALLNTEHHYAINVELRTTDESGTGCTRPVVELLLDDKPYLQVEAYIDRAKGADSGLYPIVRFGPIQSLPIPGGYECDGTNCPPRAHDHKVLL